MRYITTLRDRSKFTTAVGITTGAMTAVFVALGGAGVGVMMMMMTMMRGKGGASGRF